MSGLCAIFTARWHSGHRTGRAAPVAFATIGFWLCQSPRDERLPCDDSYRRAAFPASHAVIRVLSQMSSRNDSTVPVNADRARKRQAEASSTDAHDNPRENREQAVRQTRLPRVFA